MFPDRPLVDVPLSHPIYHIVYDFPKGIPKIHEHDGLPARGFGIFLGDRLAVYYSFSSDLGNGWEDPEVYHDPPELHEAALRMGVNLFVYAVTSRPDAVTVVELVERERARLRRLYVLAGAALAIGATCALARRGASALGSARWIGAAARHAVRRLARGPRRGRGGRRLDDRAGSTAGRRGTASRPRSNASSCCARARCAASSRSRNPARLAERPPQR